MSDLAAEIWVAKLYAQESWRVTRNPQGFLFRGTHKYHLLTGEPKSLVCTCSDYRRSLSDDKRCKHSRALRIMIDDQAEFLFEWRTVPPETEVEVDGIGTAAPVRQTGRNGLAIVAIDST
ncbi:MAG: hypothetical protein IT331_17990 [Anaerolineae bacterium]|nr:hypothetical protein [Anaerolineae bacterium]